MKIIGKVILGTFDKKELAEHYIKQHQGDTVLKIKDWGNGVFDVVCDYDGEVKK